MKIFARAGMLTALGCGCLLGDFSYQQTHKLTGGVLAGMMKVAGVFSKQAREPITSTVRVKGDRMATLSASNGHIVDLQKETITEIDFRNKTYSVVTFGEMARALKEGEARRAGERGEQADITVKASVQQTGQSKLISGLQARQVLLTVELEGTDSKTGQRGVFMVLNADMWLADVPGYQEVKSFYQRMSQKLAWSPGAVMAGAQRADVSKGMAELAREAAKLDGVPVYEVIRMNLKGEQESGAEAAPRAEQPAEQPSVGGALGRFGGLGRLGRLGRKREPAEQPKASETAPTQGETSALLMEMTAETTGFSTAPVDPAQLEVPAGFKQVESRILRPAR